MLQIMNPKPLQLTHNGASNDRNIGIVVKYWENAKPLIKELEQTVNFAERKCGDLMQQLNLCKEYYEKWSTERSTNGAVHKRKPKKRLEKKCGDTRSSSENESETVQQMSNSFNEKLKNKIYEIKNEIKETNRKISMKDVGYAYYQKENDEGEKASQRKFPEDNKQSHVVNESEVGAGDVKETHPAVKSSQSKLFPKRKAIYTTRHTTKQKYKLRSKSLPQGVRRKFGFGSFFEIRDKQRPKKNENALKIKSRTTVSSGSKSKIWKSNSRPKSDKSKESDKPKSVSKASVISSVTPDNARGAQCSKSCSKMEGSTHKLSYSFHHPQNLMQNIRSCTSITNDCNSSQIKFTYFSEENCSKLGRHKSLMLAPRQPIPFTICRTSKTFNLGLNIQQVLSLIKSKKHSAMLQAVLRDNVGTARSVIHKTEPNIDALFIATSSRIGRTSDSEICPAREDGDRCYSIISTNSESTIKCKMLTCRQSIKEDSVKENRECGEMVSEPLPFVTQISFNDIQRPEDVWVVEQPDHRQSLRGFRARCTCFPSRNSVDYQKVLKQYSSTKKCEENRESFKPFPPSFVMSSSGFCSLSSRPQLTYDTFKMELKKVQEDLDNLTRRYERLQERITEHNLPELEADAELDTLELELNYKEEDCRQILNFYDQLTTLKKKTRELRGRIRSRTSVVDGNGKQQKSRKDPFRPTPSMTLTRVLRQIQCLQDKIKLIHTPSIT